MKLPDFYISKVTFSKEPIKILEVVSHSNNGNFIDEGVIKNRQWLLDQYEKGKSFNCITKTKEGKWKIGEPLVYENKCFKIKTRLPRILSKRKSFISYYHADDETYKIEFENLTKEIIVNKSVQKDDINSENSDQYIKQLIQKDYLKDTTVLIVLLSNSTRFRKHIDWEISGALNLKVGSAYSGLIGILLPSHPDFGKGTISDKLIPPRLLDNITSGYAIIKDWTENVSELQDFIEIAYDNRISKQNKIENSRIQMSENKEE